MERFTKLFCDLDQTTRTNDKVAALENYFRQAPAADAAWALQFLSGNIPARVVSTRNLRDWAAEETGLPQWLMDECWDTVGDFGETLALVFPDSTQGTTMSLSELVRQRLLSLRSLPEISRHELLLATWRELNSSQRLIYNKLITGEFRVGVSRTLVIRALANVAGIEPAIMAHRVLGAWQPTVEDYNKLLSGETRVSETARPYPFFLASPIETKVKPGEPISDVLGDVSEWQVEWKWDGIRAQLIHRNNETCIWSRGDEMVTDSFPEIVNAGDALPGGTVLDGEIVAWKDGHAQPFAQLQRRLGRKKVSARIQEEFPVAFLAYDLLELDGIDFRARPLGERRVKLEEIVEQTAHTFSALAHSQDGPVTPFLFEQFEPKIPVSQIALQLSPVVQAHSWEQLEQIRSESRERNVEGLMLKRRNSEYGVGRQRGDWWKWKIDPFVIDAVLIAAQRGHGRRATLYTDYTFGLWDNGELIPVAKAYSGLTDDEIAQVDAFVRRNTISKHGSVRILKPALVFELAFEGIQQSSRHKSGLAVRFPRMLRWRHDKKPAEADTVDTLRSLLNRQNERVLQDR